MTLIKWIVIVLLALVVLAVGAGRLGLLRGRVPTDLGVKDGRLKAPSTTRNSVSSQASLWPGYAQAQWSQIAPLALRGGDGPTTLATLQSIVAGMPGAKVVTSRPDYLYAQFTTKLMQFTDDVEFWLDPAANVVQVRSASRVGAEDFNVNRQRIEAIRARLAQP